MPKKIQWEAVKQPMPEGLFTFQQHPPQDFCAALATEFEHRASELCMSATGRTPCLPER